MKSDARRAAAPLILASIVALSGIISFAEPAPHEADLNRTVAYLIDYVANSEVTFIRNGQPHGSREAAQHMKDKYSHFKREIKTPEDFIRLAASKSELSGRPYLVRIKYGTEMKSADWLGGVLNDYRRSQNLSDKR